MFVLLIALLAPALATFAILLSAIVRWRGQWQAVAGAMMAMFLIGVALHFWPQPSNIWPIGLFGLGIVFLIPLGVIYIAKAIQDHNVQRREKILGKQCIQCGYDLRSNVTGRCPECGAVIAPEPMK